MLAVCKEFKRYLLKKKKENSKKNNRVKYLLCTRLVAYSNPPLGGETNRKALCKRCFKIWTKLTKSLPWELGRVLAIVLDDLVCQWQRQGGPFQAGMSPRQGGFTGSLNENCLRTQLQAELDPGSHGTTRTQSPPLHLPAPPPSTPASV